LSGYGISASDAQADCQGDATCVSFLTGLGNQDVAAKSIATMNWSDISNAVYMQNAQQALISSGFSPTTAAVLSAATPLDAAGAAEPAIGSATDSGVPGRVQSRINVTNDGLDHIGDRHLDSTVNASQFTISESDLTNLLQSPNIVSTPVTRTIQSGGNINYVREVNAGQVVGTDKFNNYQPTSTMTVITDKYGNLVTAFPGKLK
jgi:filamentous hemagglutinin